MNGARTAVLLALLAASAAFTLRVARPRAIAPARLVERVPRDCAGWQGVDSPLTDRQYELLETRDVLFRSYLRAGEPEVLACVALSGTDGKAAHPPEICYRGQGFEILDQRRVEVEIAGRHRQIDRLRIRRDRLELLVWSWYRVGDEETPDWWREQQLALSHTLRGHDERAALLRFSTVVAAGAGGEAAAERRLADFAGNFLPPLDAALAAAASSGESRGAAPSK